MFDIHIYIYLYIYMYMCVYTQTYIHTDGMGRLVMKSASTSVTKLSSQNPEQDGLKMKPPMNDGKERSRSLS